MDKFSATLDSMNVGIRRARLRILQANLGDLCNQRCAHCHIGASPEGRNVMSKGTIDKILGILDKNSGLVLDVTGGAPELNPHFEYMVRSARPLTEKIIVRSNLTVMWEPDMDYLPDLFKENRVHLICSLPCFTREATDLQRGRGVFEKSIRALKVLNDFGFGKDADLSLDIMHNPQGAVMSDTQPRLEEEFKHALGREHRVYFNRLLKLNNVPINRFRDALRSSGKLEDYIKLLAESFNAEVTQELMCRSLLSVGWDGLLYDCDFNLALRMPLKQADAKPLRIEDLDIAGMEGRKIEFGEHCFACTAGCGSSCQGELRDNVRQFYQQAALNPKKELCCPVSYKTGDVSHIPEEVLEVSYGCGSPVQFSGISQGETVVDLGCGAGIDCFIAAKQTGISGRVIGIDMTQEMLEKANAALEKVALKLGFLNCEFRQGFLERIPVESDSADAVVSNCVVNLSADKSKVFAEIHRILKNAGRFVIADIVADRQVPVYLRNNQRLWGECISGALTQDEFLSCARNAGFYGLQILKSFKYREVDGIQFCSVVVRGFKFSKSEKCLYQGQYAVYLGPYAEVRDDDNHVFARGEAVEICTDTAAKLRAEPYKGQFAVIDVAKEGSSSCCQSEDNKSGCC